MSANILLFQEKFPGRSDHGIFQKIPGCPAPLLRRAGGGGRQFFPHGRGEQAAAAPGRHSCTGPDTDGPADGPADRRDRGGRPRGGLSGDLPAVQDLRHHQMHQGDPGRGEPGPLGASGSTGGRGGHGAAGGAGRRPPPGDAGAHRRCGGAGRPLRGGGPGGGGEGHHQSRPGRRHGGGDAGPGGPAGCADTPDLRERAAESRASGGC